MTDSTTTRIKLPTQVHRRVKAAAVLHGVKTDEALGICVAFLAGVTSPLCWLDDLQEAVLDLGTWAEDNFEDESAQQI